MGLIFACGCIDIFAILLSLAICIVTYFKWSFLYWKKQKIPYIKPRFPWGTLGNPFINPKSFGDSIIPHYQEAKQNGYKVVGLYGFVKPICMIIDPYLIKHIMTTDFKYFMNRGVYYNEKDDPLSAHLFAIEGTKWRNLRIKFTPTFTTGKMKMMFGILEECSKQLIEAVSNLHTNEPIDIKDILARFTTNIIGSAAFGLECNMFADGNLEFREYGKLIFSRTKMQLLQDMIVLLNPDFGRRLGMCALDKNVTKFFGNVIKETVDYREKNNIERNDFLQLLIHLKNGTHNGHGHDEEELIDYEHDGKTLTLNELSAQAFLFFGAGFETSSTTMTFCLFELTINKDIQEKVRREVQEVLKLHGGKLTYDSIHDMKYLGQVIEETLRKYSPLPILNRKCSEDYKIPGTDLIIEKDTPIFIPLVGLHNDPEYFPNPEKFDPDRFSDNNKHNIVPYTYMPFGEGPRVCIGLRFGVMQTKVGLAALLQNFKFSLNIKTKIPLKMDPSSFIQSTKGDLWLNIERV